MHKKLTLITYFISTLLLLAFTINVLSAEEKNDPVITWEDDLHFDETSGVHDRIRFGEATNAVDGSSPDSHDLPKPPPPIPPYIHAYFTTDFEVPYNMLLQDFRPDDHNQQIWNISVQWTPADFNSSTTMTLSWDPANLSQSSYSSIQLYETDDTNPVADMLTEDSYSFSAPANIPQTFQIQCVQSDTGESTTPFPSMFFLILSILIVAFLISRKKSNEY
jgi:hypothetical protein